MRLYEHSSTMFTSGRDRPYYGVAKYSIRKRWALTIDDGTCLDIAAYFRTEEHARKFAETFGLSIHAHTSDAVLHQATMEET